MKLSLTDEFLWDVYSFLEKTGDVAKVLFPTKFSMRNMLPGPKNPVFEKYRKAKNRQQFNKLIYYLKKNNFIKVKNLQGKKAILITKRGIDKALKVSFKIKGGGFKKRRDGKWIMLIFDIPKQNKKHRTLLRSVLKNLGYKIFQHSVWVTPYDVSEKTERSLQFYSLDRYVRVFLVEEL